MALLYVLVKCKTGSEKDVKISILTLGSAIDRIDIVTGEYDIIIKIKAETTGQLQSVVLGKIRNIENIIQTVSLPVIET